MATAIPNFYCDNSAAEYTAPTVVDRWLQLLVGVVKNSRYLALVPVADTKIAALFEQYFGLDRVVRFDSTDGKKSRSNNLKAALEQRIRELKNKSVCTGVLAQIRADL